MNICIKTPDKETWDKAQLACFKHGWDWEGEDYIEFGSDEWKSDPKFTLNDDSWDEMVSHLCVMDGVLCISCIGDTDPVEDGFILKTVGDLNMVS